MHHYTFFFSTFARLHVDWAPPPHTWPVIFIIVALLSPQIAFNFSAQPSLCYHYFLRLNYYFKYAFKFYFGFLSLYSWKVLFTSHRQPCCKGLLSQQMITRSPCHPRPQHKHSLHGAPWVPPFKAFTNKTKR